MPIPAIRPSCFSGSLSADLTDAGQTCLRRIKTQAALTNRRRAAWAVAYSKRMAEQLSSFAKLPMEASKQGVLRRAAHRFDVTSKRASAQAKIAKAKHERARENG
ncbi:MAG: hypothetical protein WAO69_00090 [Aestuariivita sp.]|uniref:hypothetical protein n=1 Tax=Aestuariivita sp. TaxID=1872407 RepID=UPI003BB00AB9